MSPFGQSIIDAGAGAAASGAWDGVLTKKVRAGRHLPWQPCFEGSTGHNFYPGELPEGDNLRPQTFVGLPGSYRALTCRRRARRAWIALGVQGGDLGVMGSTPRHQGFLCRPDVCENRLKTLSWRWPLNDRCVSEETGAAEALLRTLWPCAIHLRPSEVSLCLLLLSVSF